MPLNFPLLCDYQTTLKEEQMEELTQDTLHEVLSQNEKVIVQYGASWCGACKMIKPTFKSMANENEGIKFLYVDAEKLPESRKHAKVDNLPTFAGFVNGQLIKQAAGTKAQSIQGVLDEIASH